MCDSKLGYRLGDVTMRWFSRVHKSAGVKQSIYELRQYTLSEHPGSIAARHIRIMGAVNGWAISFNFSMVSLSQALEEWEMDHNISTNISNKHAYMAVHLRLGDGIGVTRQRPPPVSRWAALGGRLQHVHIVTGIHVDFGMRYLNASVVYLLDMRTVLASVGVHVTLRLAGTSAHFGDHGWDALHPEHVKRISKSSSQQADEDFHFMVNADEFIVGRGSFSYAISEVRNLRGRRTWILENETTGMDGIFPQVPPYMTIVPAKK